MTKKGNKLSRRQLELQNKEMKKLLTYYNSEAFYFTATMNRLMLMPIDSREQAKKIAADIVQQMIEQRDRLAIKKFGCFV